MAVIRDLKPDNSGLNWLEGKFDSMSLWNMPRGVLLILISSTLINLYLKKFRIR